MNGLASGFHPSFDALSAHADRGDVERARTRVGRHVATCARCREIVEEIHAMGDSVRAAELPGAPAGLWARIEQSVAQGAIASSARSAAGERVAAVPTGRDVDAGATKPDGAAPTGSRDWQRRVALGVLVAAVLGSGVIVAGSLRQLGAATPSRLALSREYVAPGGSVVARYRPIAALADARALTVWARYEGATVERGLDQPLVRAGTLRRVSPQEYTGPLTLPAGALVGFFAVGDSAGRVLDRSSGRPRFLGAVLATDASGRPSLDALVALLGRYRDRLENADVARLADVMEREYPSRPETWLVTYPIEHRGLVRDIVKQFESRERAYAGWHSRLAGVPGLSLYVEQAMANIGEELMDSTRADFWTRRAMADHGDDPRVMQGWLVRPRRVPAESVAPSTEAAVRRGRIEAATTIPGWVTGWGTRQWLRDTAIVPALDSLLRRDLAAERSRVAVPTVWGSAAVNAERSAQRSRAIRTRLAAIQLLRGETLAAKESLDVVVRDVEQQSMCPTPETVRWRVEAELGLGQMDAARDDLAYLATMENWWVAIVGDSAPQLLGSQYSAESWATAKEAGRARWRKCFAAARERRRGEDR